MPKHKVSWDFGAVFRPFVTAVLIISTPASLLATDTTYTQTGGTASLANQTYSASTANKSGVTVSNGGTLQLSSSIIKTTGNTSSPDSSSFYGLNAGVLAKSAAKVTLLGCSITTSGIGANGVFATGSGSSITLTNDTIICTGQLGHGVDATIGGTLILTDVIIQTGPGANSAAIATDRGGGTITVTRGTMTTSGADAPGIYSTGTIVIDGATISASGSEAAVIEGTNSITLTNTTLTSNASSMSDKWGVLIYQSFSGDAQGQNGSFTMTGGSLTYTATSGPLFFVTNTSANIELKGVHVPVVNSGTLIKASVYSRWSSTVGGTVTFTGDAQALTGNLVADGSSAITASLKNRSTLTGAINAANTAKGVYLTLDSSSTWNVTANSYLSSLTDPSAIDGTGITNIAGNGHTVYYNAALSANSALGGKTYSLVNGGQLTPVGSTSVEDQRTTNPTAWILEQNYPNPFNPTTTISYQIASDGFTTLKVYNILGGEVATLVNGNQTSGRHTITFDASRLPSGMYFYQLKSGSHAFTRRMLLTK